MMINLVVCWAGVLAGFVSGMWMGFQFHRPGWLGGYGSFERRLIRLAHISFFGLALINFMFFMTVQTLGFAGLSAAVAGWLFVAGAITMPVCCGIMAFGPRSPFVFTVPVSALMGGAGLTLAMMAGLI